MHLLSQTNPQDEKHQIHLVLLWLARHPYHGWSYFPRDRDSPCSSSCYTCCKHPVPLRTPLQNSCRNGRECTHIVSHSPSHDVLCSPQAYEHRPARSYCGSGPLAVDTLPFSRVEHTLPLILKMYIQGTLLMQLRSKERESHENPPSEIVK